MRSRTDSIAYEKLKTVRQWAKLGYLPIQDAEGILLWTNNFHQGKSRYYGQNDVEKASEEALQEFFAPEKRRRREQQQRWRQKKQMEKQMEKGWESVQGQWSVCPPLKGIVIDTETTGLNFENDEILQVCGMPAPGPGHIGLFFQLCGILEHRERIERTEKLPGYHPHSFC